MHPTSYVICQNAVKEIIISVHVILHKITFTLDISRKQILIGSSRFSVGLSSDRRDGDELNQGEEIVLIPVSIGNPLSDLDPVVESFKLAS